MKTRILAAAVALAAVVFVSIFYNRMAQIEDRVLAAESAMKEVMAMNRLDYAKVLDKTTGRTRVFPRAHDETEADWAARSGRLVMSTEDDEDYQCSVLDGCGPNHNLTIEICTYCPGTVGTPECDARHAAQVAAFCAQFECTEGCD